MVKKYKVPLHIKNYVKKELYDYTKNKRLIKDLQKHNTSISTKTLLITTKRIDRIDTVLKNLNPEDKEIVNIIFFEQCSQAKAEAIYYISKDAYYNAMNKVIYLTAIELELI